MASRDVEDDEYVARLLQQDALDAAKKYDLIGLDAFGPKRARPETPKPNTNFLRHIIRQTDSHNAALRARESKESRARLRQLDTAEGSRNSRSADRRGTNRHSERTGKLPSTNASNDTARRNNKQWDRQVSDEERDAPRPKKARREGATSSFRPARERSRNEDRAWPRRRDAEGADGSLWQQSRRPSNRRHEERHFQYRDNYGDDDERKEEERKPLRHATPKRKHARPIAASKSPSPNCHHKSSRRRYKSRSPGQSVGSSAKEADDDKRAHRSQALPRHSSGSEAESDPLEVIVGPLPAPKQLEPAVRSRGRGAHKSNPVGIDTRFSSVYDPTMDVEMTPGEADEWGDAVEAFRDRQRWKQQGAERLKAAGFSEEQIRKWGQGEEKSEDEVRWTMRGQAREWDRGKVVDADGETGFQAEWADG